VGSILIESSTFASVAPEPDSDTFARATPFEFGLTGGSITTTAITTTDVTAATVASFLGNWVEALDGDVLGERVQIRTTAVGPPAVLGTDSWSSASPTATRFRMWTPPEPLVVATGSGNIGGTTVAATGRNEADDYYNDPDRLYLVCVESGGSGTIARGEARLISDFTSGTVTVATAFSAQSLLGDLFVMRQPIHMVGTVELPSMSATYHDRKFMKVGHSRDPGVAGLREGAALTLRGEVKGSASAASGTGASHRKFAPSNQRICRFLASKLQSDIFVHGFDHVTKALACSAQKASGSLTERSYMALYLLSSIQARWATSAGIS